MSALARGPALFHFSNRTDDSNSVEEHDEHSQYASRQGSRVIFKSSGACVHCKSLKVKCEFNAGENVCQRCQAGSYQCLPRTRKKRKPAPTHEDLQEKAHSQDLQIQALLAQFDKLKADTRINEWLARTQTADVPAPGIELQRRDIEKPRWNTKDRSAQSAAMSYFTPGHGLDSLSAPDIVKYCELYPEEIIELFKIFFERVNPFFSILDPELHTPGKLIWTCPFLFTVICSVASRYYTSRPNLYQLAMGFARDSACRSLIDGSKSVDVCQAYLLMAVYPVPKKRWTEDRSWLLMGVAIRMAIELKLNQPPPTMSDERECLNRTRTWLNCYCVDGSHAIQFGKMPMLRLDDYLARHSREWYRSSPMNMPFDVHLCAYVHIIILVAEWRSAMGEGLNRKAIEGSDVVASVLETQAKLSQELALWVDAYAEEYTFLPLAICAYRGNTTQMITAYLRLVVLAVGFQHSVKTGLTRESEVVLKSVDAARDVIQIMIERLYPTGNLRYAMEANFLYVSFAAAFLINLLRPKFLPLLDENQQTEIILIVGQLITVLGSKDVALDGRHTPALYSRFLSSLLAKHNPRPPRFGSNSPADDTNFHTQYSNERQFTPPHLYSWPDIQPANINSQHIGDLSSGEVYQHREADMDFSLSHFVKSVTQGFPPHMPEPQSEVNPDLWSHWEYSNQTPWPQTSPFPDLWSNK